MWRDGLAFISERDVETPPSAGVVHVSPPWFEPTPVANPSTGLWGTRGLFQEGVFDGEGEIGFETLALAIEAVRRAYIAGGRGGDTALAQEPHAPLPGSDPDARFLDRKSPEKWDEVQTLLPSLKSESHREELTMLLVSLWDDPNSPLRDYIDAAVEEDPNLSPDTLIADCARWRDWFRAMKRAGLLHLGEKHFFETQSDPADPAHLEEAILGAPLPRGWRLHPGLKTVRDSLCVLGSDRTFFQRSFSYRHFFPLFVAAKALTVISSRMSPGSMGFPKGEQALHDELVEKAARWLAQAFPGTELAGHRIEKVIAALARGETTPEPDGHTPESGLEDEPPASEPPSVAEPA